MLDTTLVREAKLQAAEEVVRKWCERYERAREDIPKLVERGTERTCGGKLVYALRACVDLDPISCGDLLGVHPSYVSRLQRRMRAAIEIRKIREIRDRTETFLMACGLICSPVRKKIRPSNSRIDAWLAVLREDAPLYLEKIFHEAGDVSFEDVFSYTNRQDLIEIRYIVYGVLFHIVLDSSGKRAIGAYCRTSDVSVWHGLKEFHEMLSSGRPPRFRDKVERICRAVKISPHQLLPA